MKQIVKKHLAEWKQTIVILISIAGLGIIGHAVDIWRLPEAVKLADQKNDNHYEDTKAMVAGVVSNQSVIRAEQTFYYRDNDKYHAMFWETLTNFVHESRNDRLELRHMITNAPAPVVWPDYAAILMTNQTMER